MVTLMSNLPLTQWCKSMNVALSLIILHVILFVEITNDIMKTWFDTAGIHKLLLDVVAGEVDMRIAQIRLILSLKNETCFSSHFHVQKMWFCGVPSANKSQYFLFKTPKVVCEAHIEIS